MKEFLLEKRHELTKKQVEAIKNDEKFTNERLSLDGINPSGGKHVELTADAEG